MVNYCMVELATMNELKAVCDIYLLQTYPTGQWRLFLWAEGVSNLVWSCGMHVLFFIKVKYRMPASVL